MLKPFLPQLQMTTLTKALNDASPHTDDVQNDMCNHDVRLRAADALRQLVTIQIKFPHFILQLIIDSGHQRDNSLAHRT